MYFLFEWLSAKTGEGVTVSIESLAKQCAFAIQE